MNDLPNEILSDIVQSVVEAGGNDFVSRKSHHSVFMDRRRRLASVCGVCGLLRHAALVTLQVRIAQYSIR